MVALPPDKLNAVLDEAVARLRDALAPTTIILHGSYVHGTPRAHSDLDILVIVDRSDLTPHARDAIAYEALIGLGIPKDVQVYTRDEFDSRAALAVSFERTVKEKGRVLYAS